MTRRLVAALIAAVLLIYGVASVGASGGPGESKMAPAAAPAPGGKLYASVQDWPMLTSEFVNAPTTEDALAYKEIAKRFNVQFRFELATGADLTTKVNLAIASGKMPYIIASNPGVMSKYYGTGIVADLTPHMLKYGQDFLKEAAKDAAVAKNLKTDDGKYYFFSQFLWDYDHVKGTINKVMLDQAKVAVPVSTEDFFNAMVKLKALDPAKIIPWTKGRFYAGTHALEMPIYLAYGTGPGWQHFKEGEYLFSPYERREEMKEALTYLNRAFKQGIIDPEYLAMNNDDYNQKYRNGRVGFVFGWLGRNLDGFIAQPPFKGPKGYQYAIPTNIVSGYYYVSKSHPDPDKAVQLFNWLYTEEGKMFSNYGIEGTTYTMKDGKPVLTDMVINHERARMNGLRTMGFYPVNFPYDAIPYALDLLSAGGAELIPEGNKINKPYAMAQGPTLSPSLEEVAQSTQLTTDINNLVATMLPKFVVGEASIANDFNAFISQLEKMGVQKYISIVRGQYQRWQNRK